MKTIDIKRVEQILNKLRKTHGNSPKKHQFRLFCAGNYPVTAAQRAFGIKVRALVAKMNGK